MISKIFPKMPDSQRKFVTTSVLAALEYILEVGEDGMCQEIIEEKMDVSAFPRIQKRLSEYKSGVGV